MYRLPKALYLQLAESPGDKREFGPESVHVKLCDPMQAPSPLWAGLSKSIRLRVGTPSSKKLLGQIPGTQQKEPQIKAGAWGLSKVPGHF